MKEFMMIFIGGDYGQAGLSEDQIQVQLGRWFGWVEKLKVAGKYVGGKALTPQSAKTIQGTDAVVTDGPFAEINEIVSGYFVVKANDIEEATQMAKDYPDFEYGGKVEVREVMVFE